MAVTERIFPHYLVGLALLALLASPGPAVSNSSARQCLDQAASAATSVPLAGDQSAVRRRIAQALAEIDRSAAEEVISGIRSPVDAARGLGAAARAAASADPESAQRMADTAGRLLLRLANPDRRDLEQRLLLWEVACLGEPALAAAPELSADAARDIVVRGCASRDARKALRLFEAWQPEGAVGDRARAVVAEQLADTDPDNALELAHGIISAKRRDDVLWRIASRQSPEESAAIAEVVRDPLVQSAILSDATIRLAAEDPDAAVKMAEQVGIASTSALAQLAVALVGRDQQRALASARKLPADARRWALGAIAVALAAAQPERAEEVLAELGYPPEVVRVAAPRAASTDVDTALRLARAVPAGDARDAALAAIAVEVATSDWERARDLCWEISTPRWRTHAVAAVVQQLAQADLETATSLLGLVADESEAQRLRADVAVIVAARDCAKARAILSSLPQSQYRTEAAFSAARAALDSGGSTTDAIALASTGASHDTALRWLVPTLARTGTESPVHAAEAIGDPYLRAMSLVDAAKTILHNQVRPLPSSSRARQVRLVVDWPEAP